MQRILKVGIAGVGEVGGAFKEIIESKDRYELHLYDPPKGYLGDLSSCHIIHICTPAEYVVETIGKFGLLSTCIIHSTVPVGTCQKASDLGGWVFHAPVRGRHPLVDEIQNFKLWVSMCNTFAFETQIQTQVVKHMWSYLSDIGFDVELIPDYKITELAKLYCTTRLGWEVLFMREVYETCKRLGAPFEKVYTEWNKDYNEGFDYMSARKYQYPKFHRTVLDPIPGKIGGHCVTSNAELLSPHSDIAKKIVEEAKKDWSNE